MSVSIFSILLQLFLHLIRRADRISRAAYGNALNSWPAATHFYLFSPLFLPRFCFFPISCDSFLSPPLFCLCPAVSYKPLNLPISLIEGGVITSSLLFDFNTLHALFLCLRCRLLFSIPRPKTQGIVSPWEIFGEAPSHAHHPPPRPFPPLETHFDIRPPFSPFLFPSSPRAGPSRGFWSPIPKLSIPIPRFSSCG